MTIAPDVPVTAAVAVVDEIVWDAVEFGSLLGQVTLGYQLRATPLRGACVRLSEPDLIEALEALARTRAAVERVEVELVREALSRGLPQQGALSAVNWIRTTEGGQVPPPDAAHAARVTRLASAAAAGPDVVTERTIASFFAGGLSATKTDQVLRLVADVTKITDPDQLAEVVEALRIGSIDGADPLASETPASDAGQPGSNTGDTGSASDTSNTGDADHGGHVPGGDVSSGLEDADGPASGDGSGLTGSGRTAAVPSWVTGMAPDPALPWTRRTSTGPTGWGLSTRDLGTAIRYTRRLLKPADLLAEEEGAARRGRALHALPGPGGLTDHKLTLDAEGAALVDAAVSALSRPRPTSADGVADLRTAAHRRADALLEVIQRGMNAAHATGTSGSGSGSTAPGQPRAQVVVTIGLSDLLAQTQGAGITATGQVLSPDAVRRIACDAQIIPMILGGKGQPLDVGRGQRFFTDAQRIALFERDRHCTFPGCTIPAQWCDAHHLIPWAEGGRTDLILGALLCRLHHSYVHQHRLTAVVTAMGVRWNLRT